MIPAHLEIPKNLLLTRHLSLRKKIELAKRFWLYRKTKTGKKVMIEITSVCNAKCYYCTTGFANRNHTDRKPGKTFIEVDFFEKILKRLKATGILTPGTQFYAFHFGEAMLHPEFEKIMHVTSQENCLVALSSNGNVLPKLSGAFDASNVISLILSMPGFSQASYDKIHQFDFERIKHNMAWLVKTFRQHGCVGEIFISYHIYQWNLHELKPAYDFAKRIGARILPIFSYIHDHPKLVEYAQKTLPTEYLYNVSKDLLMGLQFKHLEPVKSCSAWGDLMVNVEGKCGVCCEHAGYLDDCSVFDMTPESWLNIQKNSTTCQECMACGLTNREIYTICDMKQLAKAFQR